MKMKMMVAGMLFLALSAGVIAGRFIRTTKTDAAQLQNQPASQSEEAALETDSSVPVVTTCDGGQVVVTPFVQDGKQMVRVDCIQGQRVETAYVPATQYAAYSPARRQVVADREAPRVRRHHRRRSLLKEILIVGGSAGAGTAIGAVAGGKKGAAIGAVSGGVAGLVYDLATRRR